MRRIVAAALLAVVVAGGCFKFEAKFPERIQIGGGDGPATSQAQRPTQLPLADGWVDIAMDIAGGILGGEQEALFYAYDTLAYPGQPVQVGCRLMRIRNLQAIEGVTVDFLKGDIKLASAKTDAEGFANIAWAPPAAADYELKVRIAAVPEGVSEELLKVTPAPLLVAATPRETEFVVVDLDRTLVDAGFASVLLGSPRPMADSPDVLGRIAKRYKAVYLTHRPDLLTVRSKDWLREHDFPTGPLLVSELSDILDSGRFKSAKLGEMIKAYPNVRIGIGDKISDAQAYVDNGIAAYLIPNYKQEPKAMRELAAGIRSLKGDGKIHVVDGWKQIEQSVFQDKQFPPDKYADELIERAKRLEAAKGKAKEDD